MNNNLLILRIKNRLNKLDSNDYDNFECWQIVQAFNEEQYRWASELSEHGESTNASVDDIEILLKEELIKGINKQNFFETIVLPDDLMRTKRVQIKILSENCETPQNAIVYDAEEANVDALLRDENRNPSFEWRETFKTHISNKIRVYTQNKFKVVECSLIYYRNPKSITFEGCVNENNEYTSDNECEFKDDIIIRQLIPRTCANLAGDIENFNQVQRNIQTIT